MKHKYLIIISIFFFQFSFGQIVNIPDANLKNALINTLCVDTDGVGGFDADADLNNDGEIQVTEAETVISLNLSNQNITSIVGLFSFSNLEKLSLGDNQITGVIDFTSLIHLKELECSANQLTQIDISNLSNLDHFNCSGNDVASVNFSGTTNLEYFDVSNNIITNLDFTGFKRL